MPMPEVMNARDEPARGAGEGGHSHDRRLPGAGDFRALVEKLPLIVYIDAPDPVSPSLYVSPQTVEVLGYTPGGVGVEPRLLRRHPAPRRSRPRGRGDGPHDRHGRAAPERVPAACARTAASPGCATRACSSGTPTASRCGCRATSRTSPRPGSTRPNCSRAMPAPRRCSTQLSTASSRSTTAARSSSSIPLPRRIFGYARDAALGRQMADLIVQPAVRKTRVPGFRHYLATSAAADQVKRIEAVGVRADGCEFPLELSIAEVDVPGDPLHTVYVRDITDQKLREAALLESEAIVGSSFDAIVGRTVDGIITSWNAAAERIFGYTAEEVLGGRRGLPRGARERRDGLRERAPDAAARWSSRSRSSASARTASGSTSSRRSRRSSAPPASSSAPRRSRATSPSASARRRSPRARRSCSSSWPGAPSCRVSSTTSRASSRSTATRCSPRSCCSTRDGVHLRHGAAPSLPAAYCEAIDGIAIGPSVGSCGTAAFRRERVCVSDISTDPLWRDYRELALAAGLQACWSTPIFATDGSLLGTFALYYREPAGAAPATSSWSSSPTHVAGIAIERARSEEAARASEERYRDLFENANEPIATVTLDRARSLEVNSGLRAHARLHARRADRHEPGRLPDARIDRDVDARDASASSPARSRARSSSRSSSPGTGTP